MKRPGHGTVVAYLALFIALTGGAYALTLPKNSVKAKQIAKNAVRAAEIKDNAVGAGEIGVDAVGAGEIGGSAVGASEIEPNAVGGEKVANDSLTGADVDESTLAGLLTPSALDGVYQVGGSLPSGTTIVGGWAVVDLGSGGTDFNLGTVNFPLPAPVPLTDETVNFAPSNAAHDDDPSCSGTTGSPTAPPGKVCLYIDSGLLSPASLDGGAFNTASGGDQVRRAGFYVFSGATATVNARGSWAYTAP